MDPENFDIYGGVVHAEYCFQVTLEITYFSFIRMMLFEQTDCFHVCDF
jgi:hypothetical protein